MDIHVYPLIPDEIHAVAYIPKVIACEALRRESCRCLSKNQETSVVRQNIYAGITCNLLLITYTTYDLLLNTDYVLLITYDLPLSTCYLLPTTYHLLARTYHMLFTTYLLIHRESVYELTI